VGNIDGTTFPDDIQTVDIQDISGTSAACPTNMPNHIMCIEETRQFISENSKLRNVDVSNGNFSRFKLNNAVWYNVYGIIRACPIRSPKGWTCTPAFDRGFIFVGPGVDFTQYDFEFPLDVNVKNVNLNGVIFKKTSKLIGLNGNIFYCPETLPNGYICESTSADMAAIIGPYVNFEFMSLGPKIKINKANMLLGVKGKLLDPDECPSFSQKMIQFGYMCSEFTDGYILGPGIEITNVETETLIDAAEANPKLKLDYAKIHENYLVSNIPSRELCHAYPTLLNLVCKDECL